MYTSSNCEGVDYGIGRLIMMASLGANVTQTIDTNVTEKTLPFMIIYMICK